ncbi:MAG: SDR family oxidoreductase, partial [Planctomycetota bacterium]
MNGQENRPVGLVTGSTRGIGLEVARCLADRGWRTHVVWRTLQSAELEERFPGRVHRADLVVPEDCRRVVGEVLECDGHLDGVVHAVGEYLPGSLEGLAAADFTALFQNNVASAHLVT